MSHEIYWNLIGKEIIFNLNWIEYHILKRIFEKRKYQILKDKEIRGKQISLVVIDEVGKLKNRRKIT